MHTIFIIFIIALIVWKLYRIGNPFINRMIYRWRDLYETKGGGES